MSRRFQLPPSVPVASGSRPPVRAVQWGFDKAGLRYRVVATAPGHVVVKDERGRRRRAIVQWGRPWCRITAWQPG
ncbi:MAG: hypothetical protein AAGA99_09415 [Actinomycetota bacterium]